MITLLAGTSAVYCAADLVTLNRYVFSGETGLEQYEAQLNGISEEFA